MRRPQKSSLKPSAGFAADNRPGSRENELAHNHFQTDLGIFLFPNVILFSKSLKAAVILFMWAQFRSVALQICCGCKSPLAIGAFLVLIFGTQQTFACSCETNDQPRKDAREYYTKIFDGAIFTGTIKAINNPATADGGITMSELSVEVDEYWLGVTTKTVSVLVFGPGTSCSNDWKVGTKTFFIASRYKNLLFMAICDLANWGGDYPNAKWAEYTYKTLGPSKRFPKPKGYRQSDLLLFNFPRLIDIDSI